MMKSALLEQTNKSLKGNFLYQSPEVANEEKPYTIKVDVFSIGIIIVETLLYKQLKPMQIFNFKQQQLSEIVPDIQNHQNYDFIEQIINFMVNYQLNERLKPMKLLQKLKAFTVDQNSLKNLKLPNSNQIKNQNQLPQQKIQQVQQTIKNQVGLQQNEQSLKFDQALYNQLICLKNMEFVQIIYEKNKFKNEEVLAFQEILSQCNQMKQIQLAFSNCELSDQQFLTIFSIFNKEELFQKLDTINLDISFSKMIDSKSICNVISTFKNYKKLKQIKLWVSYLNLNSDILDTISSTLEYLPGLCDLTLSFTENKTNYESLMRLVSSLQKYNKNLFYLWLFFEQFEHLYCIKIQIKILGMRMFNNENKQKYKNPAFRIEFVESINFLLFSRIFIGQIKKNISCINLINLSQFLFLLNNFQNIIKVITNRIYLKAKIKQVKCFKHQIRLKVYKIQIQIQVVHGTSILQKQKSQLKQKIKLKFLNLNLIFEGNL
ncbi:hypothetical protein ABPG74_004835 [Tetrahymena malaccensis]